MPKRGEHGHQVGQRVVGLLQPRVPHVAVGADLQRLEMQPRSPIEQGRGVERLEVGELRPDRAAVLHQPVSVGQILVVGLHCLLGVVEELPGTLDRLLRILAHRDGVQRSVPLRLVLHGRKLTHGLLAQFQRVDHGQLVFRERLGHGRVVVRLPPAAPGRILDLASE